MKFTFLIIIATVLMHNTYAQLNFIEQMKSIDSNQVDTTMLAIDTVPSIDSIIEGELLISADTRLNEMIQKQKQINEKNCPNLVKGYRVQIYSANGAGSNQKAREIRTKFLTIFPEIPAYQNFDQTDFKVRVGNCRSKLEAERIKKEINQEFPGCFIVPDFIETEVTKDCQ